YFHVTGVQTCALPISTAGSVAWVADRFERLPRRSAGAGAGALEGPAGEGPSSCVEGSGRSARTVAWSVPAGLPSEAGPGASGAVDRKSVVEGKGGSGV